MRIAFISDIHGNLHSLELVLADIKKEQVDEIVCLGDVASLGPQPREVIARLRELEIPTIMGNHDHYLLNPDLTKDHLPRLRDAELWCLEQLSESDLDFLRSFQSQLNFTLDQNTTLLAVHGSPRSNEEFLYPDTPTVTLDEIFSRQSEQVLLCGHTHVQMMIQHNGMRLVNPGSVGMPFEYPIHGNDRRSHRRAEYAFVGMTDGKLTVILRQLPINFEKLEESTRDSGMPYVDAWLSSWIP